MQDPVRIVSCTGTPPQTYGRQGCAHERNGVSYTIQRTNKECCNGITGQEMSDTTITLCEVTRVEVIDEDGRSYTKYLDTNQTVCYSIQDDGKTLKVFITDV